MECHLSQPNTEDMELPSLGFALENIIGHIQSFGKDFKHKNNVARRLSLLHLKEVACSKAH